MISNAIIKTLTQQKKTISKPLRCNEPESFSAGLRQQHGKLDNLGGIFLAHNVEIWHVQHVAVESEGTTVHGLNDSLVF